MTLDPTLFGLLASRQHHPRARRNEMPVCPVCADTLIAAEASAYLADDLIEYAWACDNCGYGFVSAHQVKVLMCN